MDTAVVTVELCKATYAAVGRWSSGIVSDCDSVLYEDDGTTSWSFLTAVHWQRVRLTVSLSLFFIPSLLC